jgi:hypothetical protein
MSSRQCDTAEVVPIAEAKRLSEFGEIPSKKRVPGLATMLQTASHG